MCRSNWLGITLAVISLIFYIRKVEGKAVAITEINYDFHAGSNELLFINFYADWCKYSQLLAPIFDEAADTIAREYNQTGKVLLGKVDSDKEANLAKTFKVSKYPTLKLVRNAKLLKREYRGKRSLEALTNHVQQLLKDPIVELLSIEDMQNVDARKRKTVIFIDDKADPSYNIFSRVAMDLKDDCLFFVVTGPIAGSSIPPSKPAKIIFNPALSKLGVSDEEYLGALLSYDELSAWANNRCTPLVREITFENAEELAEEGLPFLILFYHKDDTESPKIFTREVGKQLLNESAMINFLTADGLKFAHPLEHLGKSYKDLPLIAIDSFRHMYLFSEFNDIHTPGKLKDFILDLFTGKLHKEFHYGKEKITSKDGTSTVPAVESTFRKLGPSKDRYTLLKEEL